MGNKVSISRRFAIVDEWVINLDISDRAFKLYAILARYADNDTHKAFPSRDTLAARLRCSKASVDRAVTELVDAKAIEKRHRAYNSVLYTVLVDAPEGVITHEDMVSSPVSTDVVTRDDVTRTTELEPENYIEAKKNATSMPDNFEPSETIIDTFENKYGSVLTYEDTLEAFRDYHLAKGSRFKDWDAAFRTWCRNAITFKGPKTVIHKQELKPNAEIPDARAWVKQMHGMGEHFECRPGEFGCK
jgi:predicted transcriptional regulator